MNDSPSAPIPRPPRTWRPMAMWSAGIVLGLALVGAAAWSTSAVRQVEKALYGCRRSLTDPYASQWEWEENSRREIAALGGPQRAETKIAVYLAVPRRWADDRRSATMLLGACGEQAVPRLVRLLNGSDPSVRLHTAWALGLLKSSDAVVPLVGRLEAEPDASARRTAAWALGEIADARAVGALAEALGDGDDNVRMAAVKGLSGMGRAAAPAVPRLAGLISGGGEILGDSERSAIMVLGQMGPDARAAVPALIARLKGPMELWRGSLFADEKRETRVLAAEALGLIGPDAREAIPALEAVLKEGRPLMEVLGITDPEGRKVFEEMLQKEPDAIRNLEAQIRKDDEPFRSAAAEALKKIRGQEPPK